MPYDDLIAIHEAGHAMMATVLGFALLRVQVGDDDPRYDLAPGPSRRLDWVRVLMARGAAEEVVFDRKPIGTGSDDQQIADMLQPDDNEVALRGEVARFLDLNRGTLRYLAVRLARRGVLSGDEVEALVRGFPRRHPWLCGPPLVRGAFAAEVKCRPSAPQVGAVNVKTAEALGFTMLPMLLARADEVITCDYLGRKKWHKLLWSFSQH